MTGPIRGGDSSLSTDVGVHPDDLDTIGSVPGHGAEVDISGYPGGGAGWGAWPEGMGTSDEMPDGASPESDNADADAAGERIGDRHGRRADGDESTGPGGT
jgi:hypothetical protein